MSAREDDLACVLAYLELTATCKLNGLLYGSSFSTATGEGSEPVDSCKYVIGDDVRQMGWVVTARTRVPHVHTSEAEHELECWIVAEPVARLSTGLTDTIKRHLPTVAVGAVTMLSNAPGSRTGLIAGGIPVSAGQGRVRSLMLLKQLADATAGHNLAADIGTVMIQAPRVRLLVVTSDFLGPLGWAHPLRVASAPTEITTIRLVDLADEALLGEDPVVMAGSATGETTELNINDKTRVEYAVRASVYHERVINGLRKRRVRVTTLRTDSD